MKLSEIVNDLFTIDQDLFICMKRPWTSDADSIIVYPDEALMVPQKVRDMGYDYFLEVSVAREVLEVLKNKNASPEDKTKLLLYYALNDAYPDSI